VSAVLEAMAETVKTSEPILSASPTASSVVKLVPVPVTAAVPAVTSTVPVSALERVPLAWRSAVGLAVPRPRLPSNRETPSSTQRA